jgi:hypothetical protein
VLFVILLGIVRLAAAQTRITDVSQSSFKGKVKCVTTYTFRGENHVIPDTTVSAEKTIETFDEKGWTLEEKMYDKNGILQDRFSFEYIGDSIVVKNLFDGDGQLLVKYIFKYDGRGKETEFNMTYYVQSPIRRVKIDKVKIDSSRCIYKYDELGNRISEERYNNHNQLAERTILIYNDQHQKIKSIQESFFGKEAKKSEIKYTYGNMGNLFKSEIYDDDGNRIGDNTSLYNNLDKYGNWLTETSSYSGHGTYPGDYFAFINMIKRVIEYY